MVLSKDQLNSNHRALDAVNGTDGYRMNSWVKNISSLIVAAFLIAVGSIGYKSIERLSRIEGTLTVHKTSLASIEKYQEANFLLNFTAKDANALIKDINNLNISANKLKEEIALLKTEVGILEKDIYKLKTTVINLPPVEWQRIILDNERDIEALEEKDKSFN